MAALLVPLLLLAGFLALMVYSIGLQRKAVRRQKEALDHIEENRRFQDEVRTRSSESLSLQKQALERTDREIELLTQILAELRAGRRG
jgi:hypothetical protein